MSRRIETAYKAKSPGKVAQDIKAQDSGDMVNAAVAPRKITALIRGDLSDMRPLFMEASCLATSRMIRQKSAEAIVGATRNEPFSGKTHPAEGLNTEQRRSFNEFS